MQWFKFHIAPWLRATRSLTLSQEAVYLRLLLATYESEKPLPFSRQKIYEIAGAKRAWERVAVDYIMLRFFEEQADGYHQLKATEQIASYRARHKRTPPRTDDTTTPREDALANDINVPDDELATVNPIEEKREEENRISKSATGAWSNIEWLTKFTGAELQARKLIGKWCKEIGDAEAAEVLATARAMDVAEPVSWIMEAIKVRKRACLSLPPT